MLKIVKYLRLKKLIKMSKEEIECGAITLDTPIKIISTDKYRSTISVGENFQCSCPNEDVMAFKKTLESAYKLGYSDASYKSLNQKEDEKCN